METIRSNMDARELENLVRRHAARAWHLAMALVGRSQDAEDLVQQAFLVAARKPRPAEDAAWAWLARILVFEARNSRRRDDRRACGGEIMDEVRSDQPTPESLAADAECLEALREALAALDPSDREAVVLVHMSGLSVREAARVLDLPRATLGDRVERATGQLRRRVGAPNVSMSFLLAGLSFAPPSGGMESAILGWIKAIDASSMVLSNSMGVFLMAKKLAVVATLAACLIGMFWGYRQWSLDEGSPLGDGAAAAPPAVEVGPSRAQTTAAVAATASGSVDSKTQEPTLPLGFVSGTVRTEEGEPVEGAEIAVHVVPEQTGGLAVSPVLSGRTVSTAGGAYRLLVRTRDEASDAVRPFELSSSAAGMVGTRSVQLFLEPGAELQCIDLVVFRAGAARGRVIDRGDGRPLSGLRVSYHEASRFAFGARSRCRVEPEVLTDDDGRFSFPRLPSGPARFDVQFPLGADEWTSPICPAETDAVSIAVGEERSDVLVRVSSRVLRFGVAAKGPTSLSLQSEYVLEERDRFSSAVGFAVSGPIVLPGVDERLKRVRLRAPGFETIERAVELEPGVDLDLGEITFVTQGVTLSGRVLLSGDRPVDQADLVLTPGRGNPIHGRSGADGRYLVTGLTPGEWAVEVLHDEFGFCRESIVVLDRPLAHDWILETGATVEGRVTLAGRVPTLVQRGGDGRSSRVEVALLDAEVPGRAPSAFDVPLARRRAWIAADGSFRFRAVPPGRYVGVAAFEDRTAVAEIGEIRSGESRNVVLDVAAGGTVLVRLLGPGGLPREQAEFRLARSAQALRARAGEPSGRTGADGQGRCEGVEAGTWYLKLKGETLLAGDEIEDRKVLVRDDEVVSIEIGAKERLPVIEGFVRVDGKRRMNQALLLAPGRLLPVQRTNLDADGAFSFSGVAPGSYYLWCVDSLQAPRFLCRDDLRIVDGQGPVRVERELTNASFSGRVVGGAGGEATLRPDLDDSLGEDAAARMAVVHARLDDEGAFTFGEIVSGRYRLEVQIPGRSSIQEVIEVRGEVHRDFTAEGEAATLEVLVEGIDAALRQRDLGQADPIEGIAIVRVLDAEGRDLAEGAGDRRVLRVTEGASVSIGGLEAGRRVIEIIGRLVTPVRRTVDLGAGGRIRLPVRLERAAELHLLFENEELDSKALRAVGLRVTDASGVESSGVLGPFGGLDDAQCLARRILRLAPLEAGLVRVEIRATGYIDESLEVRVEKGTICERRLRLRTR